MKNETNPAVETPFIQTVSNLCAGDIAREASEEMENLVRAVMATGKKGKLIFTMEIKPTGIKKCVVSASVKTSVPKEDFPVQSMFATERGQLLRENPDQRLLEFREVEPEKRAAKEV